MPRSSSAVESLLWLTPVQARLESFEPTDTVRQLYGMFPPRFFRWSFFMGYNHCFFLENQICFYRYIATRGSPRSTEERQDR